MTRFVGEADDFVFDAGAIARAGGLDLAAVHRGAVQVGADDVVDGLIGGAKITIDLWKRGFPCRTHGSAVGVLGIFIQV